MSRRVLVYLSIAALAGCSAGDNTSPELKISDGAHRQAFNDPNGNVDFFFLPPMVPNPSSNPNFNAGDFNPNLIPTIEVCVLDLGPNAPESAVLLSTPCRTGGYSVSLGAPVNVALELYQGSWTVPVSPDRFYRGRVKVSGVQLGFFDAHTVASPSQLKTVNKNQFVGQQDGSSLPVKFRIEIGALCDPPGTRPCNSSTFDLITGGSLDLNPDGTGLDLPAQNSQTGQHTFTLQNCPDFNPTHTDLPQFGSCVRIKPIGSGPALLPLDPLAIVTVCDLVPDIPAGMSEEQEKRITMHRLDGTTLHALPHATGCPIVTGATTPSFKSVIKELARGHFGAAAGKLAAMVGPTPLYARRLDVGGAARTDGFSDFQFLLPAKVEKVEGDGQSAPPSGPLPINPKFRLIDLGGEPVAGVTVKVQGDGVPETSLTTTPTGELSLPWTIPLLGTNTLTVSGRGVAGDDFNGPRGGGTGTTVVDPFQPFPYVGPPTPESGTSLGPVLLQTGSVTFTATGVLVGSAFTGDGGGAAACACPASLYRIDHSTGTATLIGPIGFNRVGAMDFHPTTGVLYATGQRAGDNVPVLITIDVTTGAGTEVGPTGITTGIIGDVSFKSDGTLFVYDANPPDHTLYTVNLSNGAATLVGSTGLNSNGGNGIGFDGAGVLNHSNRDFAHTLNLTTGVATPGAAMTFPAGCTASGAGRIGATDFDVASSIFFAVVKCGTTGSPVDFLGTVDYSTGVVTLIGPTVGGLDAMARRN